MFDYTDKYGTDTLSTVKYEGLDTVDDKNVSGTLHYLTSSSTQSTTCTKIFATVVQIFCYTKSLHVSNFLPEVAEILYHTKWLHVSTFCQMFGGTCIEVLLKVGCTCTCIHNLYNAYT